MLRENVQWFGDTTTNVQVTVSRKWNVYLNSSNHSFKGVGWNLQGPSSEQLSYLDQSTPQFVRFIWYIEQYQPEENNKTYESSTASQTTSFLQHAKEKNITIMLANWDSGGKWDNYYSCLPGNPTCTAYPDHGFWLSEITHNDPMNSQNRFCHKLYASNPAICSVSDKALRNNCNGPNSDHPYSDAVFAQTLVDNIDYMINQKDVRIDFLSLWNEPAGDWAYHPRDANKTYPYSFTGLYQNIHLKLQQKNLSNIKVVALDDASASTANIDYAVANWSDYVQSYSLHNYDMMTGANGTIKYLFDRANGKPIIIGETGHKGVDGCEGAGFDRWGNSIESTRLMISDIRYGAYAVARWWFRGGDAATDCWVAMNGSTPVSANYNSLKILANTLPQMSEDISVVNTDFGDFDANFDAVVINAAPTGQKKKPVVWAVNKNTQNSSIIALNFSGLTESVTFVTRYILGVSPYSIETGENYTISPQSPIAIFTVPANSIFVAHGTSDGTTTSTTTISTTTTTTNTTTSTSTTTSSTSSTSTTTTSTTVPQCVMQGNDPPCDVISLSEVVASINIWSQGSMDLSDVIDLINSWSDPLTYLPG
jgi:hypothetical protein